MSEPRVAAGLAVGRPGTTATTTTAPDRQTAGDSRPPNAAVILLELLKVASQQLGDRLAAREQARLAAVGEDVLDDLRSKLGLL